MPPVTPIRISWPAMRYDNSLAQVGQVEFHGTAARIAFAHDSEFRIGIQENLVLHDLVDDDLQTVVTFRIHKRAAAVLQLHHALLDQRGKLEAAAHFVHDGFFSQLVDHTSKLRWLSEYRLIRP